MAACLEIPVKKRPTCSKLSEPYHLFTNRSEVMDLLKAWYSGNLGSSDNSPHTYGCKAIVYDGTQLSGTPLVTLVTRPVMFEIMDVLQSQPVARAGKIIPGWHDFVLRISVNVWFKAKRSKGWYAEDKVFQALLKLNGDDLSDEQLATMPEVRNIDLDRALTQLIKRLEPHI